jgi:hypothetical protein
VSIFGGGGDDNGDSNFLLLLFKASSLRTEAAVAADWGISLKLS